MAPDGGGGFSTPKWVYLEAWPPLAEGPVYDICYGEEHIARIHKESGKPGWRLVIRRHAEIGCDLDGFLYILKLIQGRMRSFEKGREGA